jgi:hypothetical protein
VFSQLLPLKWGISTMVLGAMAKYEGSQPLKVDPFVLFE